ncbi:MAG: hypothetical protein IKE70_04000 [Bacilli bacterium]|nr:hypothetical protein [Bacilli bacterium]
MANIYYLNPTNMPNTKFKFGKVDQKTIGISGSLDTHINNYAGYSKKISEEFKTVSSLVKKNVNANRKKFDNSTLTSLDKLCNGMKRQAEYVEKRLNSLKELIRKDSDALKARAEKAAWKGLLEALLKDSSLSESTKQVISDIQNRLGL